MSKFWNFVKNKSNETEVELRIDGDIVEDNDAWFYEWFGDLHTAPNKFRQELKSYENKDITVWINSFGGDVLAAFGIYNALKEHKGKITVKIDGYAMSAASTIAMAGDEIYMSPVSMMMIHNPWGGASGEASDMRKYAEMLDEVKEAILNAYATKTGRGRKKISEMMDNETWMSAKTAVKEGFADKIMYVEQEQGKEVQNAFLFSRSVIQNNANKAMQKFLEFFDMRLKKQKDMSGEQCIKYLEYMFDDPLNGNVGAATNSNKNLSRQGSFLISNNEEIPVDGLLNVYRRKVKNNLRRYVFI